MTAPEQLTENSRCFVRHFIRISLSCQHDRLGVMVLHKKSVYNDGLFGDSRIESWPPFKSVLY